MTYIFPLIFLENSGNMGNNDFGNSCRNSNAMHAVKNLEENVSYKERWIDGLAVTPQGGSKENYDVNAARYKSMEGVLYQIK